mmetsp:Transcript_15069/g.52907  ORF Transcript_15069/g.52907 Transcript_15069/m.52907 type:complete len:209 (+) Transcript_15069:235-861(+)
MEPRGLAGITGIGRGSNSGGGGTAATELSATGGAVARACEAGGGPCGVSIVSASAAAASVETASLPPKPKRALATARGAAGAGSWGREAPPAAGRSRRLHDSRGWNGATARNTAGSHWGAAAVHHSGHGAAARRASDSCKNCRTERQNSSGLRAATQASTGGSSAQRRPRTSKTCWRADKASLSWPASPGRDNAEDACDSFASHSGKS